MPLEDVSSSEDCLADFMNGKTAELIAAKGDPKRVLAAIRCRRRPMPTPSIYASRKFTPPMLAGISCR